MGYAQGWKRAPEAGFDFGCARCRGHALNFVGYYTDISERKRTEVELESYRKNLEELVHLRTQALEQANVELQRLATTDPLTGLFNRRTFLERGEQCQLNAQRYGTPIH